MVMPTNLERYGTVEVYLASNSAENTFTPLVNGVHCRDWSRSVSKKGKGYGIANWWCGSSQERQAHRIAFITVNGTLTEDAPIVRHLCDRPVCIEPKHLVSGTQQENMQDMVTRGRSRKGVSQTPEWKRKRLSSLNQTLKQKKQTVESTENLDKI